MTNYNNFEIANLTEERINEMIMDFVDIKADTEISMYFSYNRETATEQEHESAKAITADVEKAVRKEFFSNKKFAYTLYKCFEEFATSPFLALELVQIPVNLYNQKLVPKKYF